MRFLKISVILLYSILSLFVAGSVWAGEITAYTSLEEDEIKDYLAAASKDIPNVKVNVLRLSTGDLGARLLAEASNPKHDVIWGWALTNMADPRILAMAESYSPKGQDKLAGSFKAKDGKWFAATGYMAAFCVNTERLKQKNLPMPAGWEDLLNPVYKGEVIMPNPASSGTGYLQISAILQQRGEENGWKYLKDLDKNMGQYIKSGSKPCKMAREGEYAIGASFEFIAMKSIEEGFPIKMVIPKEGAGYELEASALMAASKNKADAKTFLDWTLSAGALTAYAKYKGIITVAGAGRPPIADKAGLPVNVESVLYKMDFDWSSKNRSRILTQWQKELER
ncbi:MAG: ABC transporter substrate-binding protein [Deltaproteobacteria bacterium]|nr:ABC transporter substrate-binding protein [Deltaproteobacteria bacterium]